MDITLSNFEYACPKELIFKAQKLIKLNKVIGLTNIDSLRGIGRLYEGKLRSGKKIFTLRFLTNHNGDIITENCPICQETMCEHFIALFFTLKSGSVFLDKRVFSPLEIASFHVNSAEDIDTFMRECINRYKINGKISDWYLPFCLDGVRLAISCIEQTADFSVRIEQLCMILYHLDRLYTKGAGNPGLVQDCIFATLSALFSCTLNLAIQTHDERNLELGFTFLYRLSKKLKDWLCRYRILKLMVYIVAPSSMRFLQNLLKTYINTMPDKASEIKALYFILLKKYDEPSAMEYMKKNINECFFRCMAIDFALEAKNYPYAQKLIDEGILLDKNEVENLADWYRYSYTLNEKTGRVAKMRSFAKKLIFMGDIDYYYHYKNLFSAEEWQIRLPKLISQLQKKKSLESVYIQILIEENSQDRLLSYCVDHPKKAIGLFPYLESGQRPALRSALMDYTKELDGQDSDLNSLQTVIKKLKA